MLTELQKKQNIKQQNWKKMKTFMHAKSQQYSKSFEAVSDRLKSTTFTYIQETNDSLDKQCIKTGYKGLCCSKAHANFLLVLF